MYPQDECKPLCNPDEPTQITPPVITITTPAPYGLYTVGMTLDFSATDDKSGVATIVGNLTNTSGVSQIVNTSFAPPVGVYTLVVTATDNARQHKRERSGLLCGLRPRLRSCDRRRLVLSGR